VTLLELLGVTELLGTLELGSEETRELEALDCGAKRIAPVVIKPAPPTKEAIKGIFLGFFKNARSRGSNFFLPLEFFLSCSFI
jgi:hypothetical protein